MSCQQVTNKAISFEYKQAQHEESKPTHQRRMKPSYQAVSQLELCKLVMPSWLTSYWCMMYKKPDYISNQVSLGKQISFLGNLSKL